MSQLVIHSTNAEVELEDLLTEVQPPAVQTQAHALAVCRACRVIGVAGLFMTGRTERFQSMLKNSAMHYLAFLQQPLPRLTSLVAPIHDAIVADQLDLARAMSQHLGVGWRADEEYEEDHLHAMLLTQHLAGTPTDTGEVKLLTRFRALTADQSDLRRNLWEALQDDDADAFDAVLEEFVQAYDRDSRRKMARNNLAPDECDTLAKLNIEGLAMLRLGRLRGFTLQSEYLLAPSLAQAPFGPARPA